MKVAIYCRLSREDEDKLHENDDKFIEWNIRFVSLVDHVDTQDKGNKKSRSIPLSQRIILDAIKNLYIDKAKGNITEDLFAELNNSFLNDKEEKENRLNYLKIKISNIEREKEDIGEIANKKQNIIDKLKNLNTINFDIVNSFIDYIEIGDKFNNTQDIVIHWNF